MNNYAFIDGNNLFLGTQVQGWVFHYAKLRKFLYDNFSIKKAYYFIGYIKDNNDKKIQTYKYLYKSLLSSGYIIKFKRTKTDHHGNILGNIDAELVFNTLLRINKYDKAIIIANDDDYYCLIKHLIYKNKLIHVMTPNIPRCPRLFKNSCIKDYLFHLYNIKEKIKYKDVPTKK